jgi:Family of unknown function (DUF6132)
MNVEGKKSLFFCFTKRLLMIMGAGIALGAAAGYLYWKFIGCASGACPITSNKLSSMLYGAAMGFLLAASGCSDSKRKSPKETVDQTTDIKTSNHE